MIESEIRRLITEIAEILEENNDILDAPQYKKCFAYLKFAKGNLEDSLEELE